MNHKSIENTATFALCVTIAVFFCTELMLNLTPPVSRDALVHHLAVPKLWLKHGGFYEIPWAEYSYYPMYINLIYFVCLYFKNDIVPKFIHFGFGLATGWLIYLYLKQKYFRSWGLLGMVIFMTTPIVVWLSTSVYIDLGMTFFSTGSVLSFIKWRDSEYNRFRWFLISSFCMGIAIGSKYNALIAWFIVNLMIMLSYVRDTKRQKAAVKYGLMFFVITVLVASPWYLKNYLQTGNPFYPLFNNLFKMLHHQAVQGVLHDQTIEQTGKISFFKIRQVMYGESFWETLLIPVRMFFQGKDNSYQYFQGSLNPILIIFLPFVFLNKRYGKDKIFFVCFTVIFLFMAYFLTAKQVRYILPVLPFLAILAVMGIKDLLDKMELRETVGASARSRKTIQSIFKVFIVTIVPILLMQNLLYLKQRMYIIKPLPYILKKESRDEFLRRHLLHYGAVQYINKTLPGDAVVFTMFLGRRGYYLNRNYKNEPSFGMNTLQHMINSSNDENKFIEYVRSMGITHILMRNDLFEKFLHDNYSKEEIERFLKLFYKNWVKLYEENAHSVWGIYDRQQR